VLIAFGGPLLAVIVLEGAAVSPSPALSIVERDAEVAVEAPGPHDGGGTTTGYLFFEKVPNPAIGFRKRVLHPGSAIGYHPHDGSEPGLGDEVYYVVSGRGELTLDGKKQEIGPGTAVLTRLGSSHGLRQIGSEDLVVILAWPEAQGGSSTR
jgi:quercetin dioxygenase-like cupin family protein